MDLDVVVCEIEYRPNTGIELQSRKVTGIASELQASLFDVVAVEMHIAEGMYEFSGLEAGDLRHHLRQEGIARDIERDSQKDVRTTLIELA